MSATRVREGTIVTVVTQRSTIALGVLIRKNPRRRMFNGVCVFAFFRPPPKSDDAVEYCCRQTIGASVLIAQVANIDLKWCGWRIVGEISPWDRTEWAVPPFANRLLMHGAWELNEYDDDEPSRCVRTQLISAEVARGFPNDGVADTDVIEASLRQILAADAEL